MANKKLMKVEVSKMMTLTWADVLKLFKGGVVAFIGTILTLIPQWISGVDFGEHNVWVIPMVSVIVNALRKWFAENYNVDDDSFGDDGVVHLVDGVKKGDEK